jgi:hypothetical protein
MQLQDGISKDLEVYKDINLYLKVRIRDRELPLNLTFYYLDRGRYKDLTVCYSQEHMDPKEGSINCASCYNVSNFIFTMFLALKNPDFNSQHDQKGNLIRVALYSGSIIARLSLQC